MKPTPTPSKKRRIPAAALYPWTIQQLSNLSGSRESRLEDVSLPPPPIAGSVSLDRARGMRTVLWVTSGLNEVGARFSTDHGIYTLYIGGRDMFGFPAVGTKGSHFMRYVDSETNTDTE